MTELVDAYRARYQDHTPGGQAIADEVGALPDEAYDQAYAQAYRVKYGVAPEAPSVPTAESAPEQNTPARLAASAGEGVVRSVWELGRTVRDVAEFITSNPLTGFDAEIARAGLDPAAVHASRDANADPGAMPDLVESKSTAETVVSGLTQFLAPFALFSKAMAGAKVFDAVGKSKAGASVLKGAAASAPVDFAFMDPIENNLFQVAKDLGFEQELSDFFGAQTVEALLPGTQANAETQLENRLKSALVNAPLGMAAELAIPVVAKSLMLTAKGLRAVRNYAGEAGAGGVGPQGLSRQRGMVAFHGSPHDLVKFDKSKIGTGEGAQAYGHGLYFAENPEVAHYYHRTLAGDPEITQLAIGGKPLKRGEEWLDYGPRNNSDEENVLSSVVEDALVDEHGLRTAYATGGERGAQEHVLKQLDERIANYYDPQRDQTLIAAAKRLRDKIARPGGLRMKIGEPTGGVYTVDIPDKVTNEMLQWDAPLAEQKPSVRKAVKPLTQWLGLPKESTGGQLYETLAKKLKAGGMNDADAWRLAADALEKAGVTGIKYHDGLSRGKGAGTNNLVLFDDKNAKVLKKNDKPVEPPKDDPQAAKFDQLMQLIAEQGAKLDALTARGPRQIKVKSRDDQGRATEYETT